VYGARTFDSSLVSALPVPWICSRIPYPVPRFSRHSPLVTAFFAADEAVLAEQGLEGWAANLKEEDR